MSGIESIIQSLPLSKDREKKLIETSKSTDFKIIILSTMLDVFNKTPKNQEEAAMLFYQALPFAKILKEK